MALAFVKYRFEPSVRSSVSKAERFVRYEEESTEPSAFRNCDEVPPDLIKESARMFPSTSNFSEGDVTPIPTYPYSPSKNKASAFPPGLKTISSLTEVSRYHAESLTSAPA